MPTSRCALTTSSLASYGHSRAVSSCASIASRRQPAAAATVATSTCAMPSVEERSARIPSSNAAASALCLSTRLTTTRARKPQSGPHAASANRGRSSTALYHSRRQSRRLDRRASIAAPNGRSCRVPSASTSSTIKTLCSGRASSSGACSQTSSIYRRL